MAQLACQLMPHPASPLQGPPAEVNRIQWENKGEGKASVCIKDVQASGQAGLRTRREGPASARPAGQRLPAAPGVLPAAEKRPAHLPARPPARRRSSPRAARRWWRRVAAAAAEGGTCAA